MSFAGFGFGMLDKLAGNLSNTYGTGDTLREKQRKDAEYDYLQRERMGIVARAEGAKAAGLHPLVGMGYQGGNSPTTFVNDSGPVNTGYAPSPSQKSDPNIDRYNAARARLAEAEATKAERDLAASNNRLATQPGNANPRLPTDPENMTPGPSRLKPGIKVVPDEVVSGLGGVTAGTHPGGTDVKVPGLGTLRLPSGKLSEALEDVELLKYAAILAMNKGRISEYFLSDIPWAARSYWNDYSRAVKDKLSYRPKSRREGGATGSW